jgi:hypothetical protein
MDKATIEACPFCEKEAKVRSRPRPRRSIHDNSYWVGCTTPNCPGNQVWENTNAKAAVESWNRRALASPDDCVRVPREPTQEMLEAAQDCDEGEDNPLAAFTRIYKAMLAAAPGEGK